MTSTIAALVLVLASSPLLKGVTLPVTSLADSGSGSLRQTLINASPGDTVSIGLEGTITLTSGKLLITKNVQIQGPTVGRLQIDAKKSSAILCVLTNVTATISDVTLINGSSRDLDRAVSWHPIGGGVQNFGTLTLTRCVVSGCDATEGAGGGVFSMNQLTLQQCTVSNNTAAVGGGICDYGVGQLAINSSTINANYTSGPVGDDGGGIYKPAGTLLVTESTISGNSSHDGAGGISVGGKAVLDSCTIVLNASGLFVGGVGATAPVTSRNSIIALNLSYGMAHGWDVSPGIVSGGYNLIQDTNGCAITGTTTGNLYGVDPLLGPLQVNGGGTPTHAPKNGSPAIDSGNAGTLILDQRGYPRIYDASGIANLVDGSDIGALEFGSSAPSTTTPPPVGGWTPAALGPKLLAWYEASNSYSDPAMTQKAPNNSLVRGLKNMVNSGTILDHMTNSDRIKVSQPWLNTNTSSRLPSLFFRANPANSLNNPYPVLNENGYLSSGNGAVFEHPHTFYVLATGQWENNMMWGAIWGEADQGVANAYEETMYTSTVNIFPTGARGYVMLMQAPFYKPPIDARKMHLWVAVFTDPTHGYLWVDGINYMNGLDQNWRPIKGLNIGGRYAAFDDAGYWGSTHGFGGDVAAFWFINRTLTPAEHTAMTNYITQRFGTFPR